MKILINIPEERFADIQRIASVQSERRVPSAEQIIANGTPLSSEPEQEWIPCSEKLPENGHYYLWCSDMGSVQSDYYWNGFENGKKYGYNIVAWQPLPEPYRGEQK